MDQLPGVDEYAKALQVESGMGMTPVEYIERNYDNWKYRSWEGSGVIFIQVINRFTDRRTPGSEFSGSSGHDQCMIRIKNDIRAHTEDEAANVYHCWWCAEGQAHRCTDCNAEVTHMAGYYCLACYDSMCEEDAMEALEEGAIDR